MLRPRSRVVPRHLVQEGLFGGGNRQATSRARGGIEGGARRFVGGSCATSGGASGAIGTDQEFLRTFMSATDPVCGKRVDPLRARAVGIFGGVTYYFCSVECKNRYRDPRK